MSVMGQIDKLNELIIKKLKEDDIAKEWFGFRRNINKNYIRQRALYDFGKKSSKTYTEFNLSYLGLYLYFLGEFVPAEQGQDKYAENVVKSFSEWLKKMKKAEEIPENEWIMQQKSASVSSDSIMQEDTDNENLYRCSYVDRGIVQCFLTKINTVTGSIFIPSPPSGQVYKGALNEIGTICSLNLATEERNRPLSIILKTGLARFERWELMVGAYLNVGVNGEPIHGKIIFELIESENECKDADLPFAVITYLNREAEIKALPNVYNLRELKNFLDKHLRGWRGQDSLLQRYVGDYECFLINEWSQALVIPVLQISSNGTVRCKSTGALYYKGRLVVQTNGSLFIELYETGTRARYWTVLNAVRRGENIWKNEDGLEMSGVYAGTTVRSRPRGGRVYYVKREEGFFDTEEARESGFNKPIFLELMGRHPKLLRFFAGECDQYIEKNRSFRQFNIPLPSSDTLGLYAGVYEYYFLRAERNGGVIRKYAMEIQPSGKAFIAKVEGEEYGGIGQAYLYNRCLQIHVFSHGYRAYRGVLTLYVDRTPVYIQSMMGTYSTHINDFPVVGRVVLLRSEETFGALVSEVIEIGSERHQALNEVQRGLADFLTGAEDNYIKIDQEMNFTDLE